MINLHIPDVGVNVREISELTIDDDHKWVDLRQNICVNRMALDEVVCMMDEWIFRYGESV